MYIKYIKDQKFWPKDKKYNKETKKNFATRKYCSRI